VLSGVAAPEIAGAPVPSLAPAGVGTYPGLGGPVHSTITSVPSDGSAPLTVHFTGNASGGTGRYVSFLWQFGDGDNGSGLSLEYTYLDPGNYTVTLNVTDSAGGWGTTFVRIHVQAPPTASLATGWPPSAVLGGGALSGCALFVGYLALQRRRRVDPLPRPAGSPAGSPSTDPTGAAASLLRPPGPGGVSTPGPGTAAPAPPAEAPEGTTPAGPPLRTRPGSAAESTLRLSQRILLHLMQQGTLEARELAGLARTQVGMGRTLGASQSAISNVLSRLAAAGVIGSELRHVAGHPRRLRVYYLTPTGGELARDLWRRSRPAPGAVERPPR